MEELCEFGLKSLNFIFKGQQTSTFTKVQAYMNLKFSNSHEEKNPVSF